MPNRMLRDWTDSEAVNSLDARAEVLFIRLIMKADDYGRFTAHPRLIRSLCFSLQDGIRDADISRQLAACEKAGLIRVYQSAEKPFLEIVKFGQRMRASKSKYPSPPDDGELRTNDRSLRPEAETRDERRESETKQVVVTAAFPASRFVVPTIEEVRAYCDERKNSVDPEKFVDFYASKGWKVGKSPMKDWRASVRTWEKTDTRHNGQPDLLANLREYAKGPKQ